VLKPCVREFWERLCGWVVPASDGGSLDIFVPLAASGNVLSQFSAGLTQVVAIEMPFHVTFTVYMLYSDVVLH